MSEVARFFYFVSVFVRFFVALTGTSYHHPDAFFQVFLYFGKGKNYF